MSDIADDLEREVELAYQTLTAFGVPRERAKNIANGIGVLEQRFNKAEHAYKATIDGLRAELKAQTERAAQAEAERDAARAERGTLSYASESGFTPLGAEINRLERERDQIEVEAYRRAAKIAREQTTAEFRGSWNDACQYVQTAILALAPGPAAQAVEELERDAGRWREYLSRHAKEQRDAVTVEIDKGIHDAPK